MRSVLVIEDNLEIRENTAELLELSGYNVHTAHNGQEGFEEVQNYHPDVIICDIMMPGTDGLGFLKLIKNETNTSKIPLIFFSADSAPTSVRKSIELGSDEYLRKPFTEEELLESVERCLDWKKRMQA